VSKPCFSSEYNLNNSHRYLVAVYDRAESSLTVLPSHKAPYILTRTVKNLKSAPLTVSTPLQYMEAKTALGEAFGTKKAKAQLRAMLRNRVDVNAMEGVMDHLQQGIDKGAASLLTKGTKIIVSFAF
jgi:DNA-directed RNA polymerase I subunit RPA49